MNDKEELLEQLLFMKSTIPEELFKICFDAFKSYY